MRKQINPESSTSGLLPFLEEAIEKNLVKDDVDYEITSVAESRKRSGWILKSENFQIYLWKSTPICDILIETVTDLTRINPSHMLVCQLDQTTVEGFSLFVDDSVTRIWFERKKLRVLTVYECHREQVNNTGKPNMKKTR